MSTRAVVEEWFRRYNDELRSSTKESTTKPNGVSRCVANSGTSAAVDSQGDPLVTEMILQGE